MMLSYNFRANIAAYRWKLKLLRYYFLYKLTTKFRFRIKNNDLVYIWPPFKKNVDDSELNDVFLKSKHYISKLDVQIVYYVESATLAKYTYCILHGKVIVVEEVNIDIAKTESSGARYCLLWRIEDVPKPTSLFPNLYSVDTKLFSISANEWLRLTSDLFLLKNTIPVRTIDIPPYSLNKCAVLGGGPSIDYYYAEQNEWDAWIGCNFIVCDAKIRKSGNPFAICILDPDFFSSMESMKQFWEDAFKLLRETSAIIITAYKFAPYIELNLPEDIKNKCLYVKTLGSDTFTAVTNFDLSDLRVTPYGNVLTDLMLPVATSVSKMIMIYGCDGRPPGSVGNFPKSSTFQVFDDKICENNYNNPESYFHEYIDTINLYTRKVVRECLKHGVQIKVRQKSWNTGLQDLPTE